MASKLEEIPAYVLDDPEKRWETLEKNKMMSESAPGFFTKTFAAGGTVYLGNSSETFLKPGESHDTNQIFDDQELKQFSGMNGQTGTAKEVDYEKILTKDDIKKEKELEQKVGMDEMIRQMEENQAI